MKLILQNKSETQFSYLNSSVVLPSMGEVDVPSKYWVALYNDVTFLKDVRFNNFLVNDGVTTFSAPDSERVVKELSDSIACKQISSLPFADKVLPNGKKIYTRIHGVSANVQGSPDNIEFTIPYAACKITGIEIFGAKLGDTANFKVMDTATGTYSGQANYVLNQFGFDVNISKDEYRYKSDYDADLYLNMKLRVEFDAIDEVLPRPVYINFILHEVKD